MLKVFFYKQKIKFVITYYYIPWFYLLKNIYLVFMCIYIHRSALSIFFRCLSEIIYLSSLLILRKDTRSQAFPGIYQEIQALDKITKYVEQNLHINITSVRFLFSSVLFIDNKTILSYFLDSEFRTIFHREKLNSRYHLTMAGVSCFCRKVHNTTRIEEKLLYYFYS